MRTHGPWWRTADGNSARGVSARRPSGPPAPSPSLAENARNPFALRLARCRPLVARNARRALHSQPNVIEARAPAWRVRGAVPARCRRHGRGLPRPRYESRPRRRAEGASRQPSRSIPSASRGSDEKRRFSRHSIILTLRPSTGSRNHRARVRWSSNWSTGSPCRTVSSGARFHSRKRGRSPGKSRKRSKRPTITGSFTAT